LQACYEELIAVFAWHFLGALGEPDDCRDHVPSSEVSCVLCLVRTAESSSCWLSRLLCYALEFDIEFVSHASPHYTDFLHPSVCAWYIDHVMRAAHFGDAGRDSFAPLIHQLLQRQVTGEYGLPEVPMPVVN